MSVVDNDDDNVNSMMPREKPTDPDFIDVTGGAFFSTTPSRKNSNESFQMSVDDDDYDNRANEVVQSSSKRSGNDYDINREAGDALFSSQSMPKHSSIEKSETYLTTAEFNYTMELLNSKINAVYKLCRYISDQQQENTKSVSKLVALDELSDGFWNVSF